MKNRAKGFFIKNFHWKAFSVLMAVILWFIVMNVKNPVEIRTFSLGIEFLNQDKLDESDIAILNLDKIIHQRVLIKIKATRPILDEFTQMTRVEQINLSLDLLPLTSYNIEDGPINIPMILNTNIPSITHLNSSFELISFSPTNVTLELDNIITIPKKIQINFEGETKKGYILSEPELSSEYIQVRGPESIVSKVYGVYAKIDILDKSETIVETIVPVAYNDQGEVIEGVEFDIVDGIVTVPINLEGAINITMPTTIGNLEKGYFVSSITYEPKKISVIGDKNDIQKLKSIKIPDINISGLNSSTSFSFDIEGLLQKNKLLLKNKEQGIIKVNVNIEKIERIELDVPLDQILIKDVGVGYKAEIQESSSINLEGQKNDINKLKVNDIELSINAKNLEEGIHNLKVIAKLPHNIMLVDDYYVEVNIIKDDINIEEKKENISEEDINNIQDTTEGDINQNTTEENINNIQDATEEDTSQNMIEDNINQNIMEDDVSNIQDVNLNNMQEITENDKQHIVEDNVTTTQNILENNN